MKGTAVAFKVIKKKLTTAPVLALPDCTQAFELHCDVSKVGIATLLGQGGRPVAYFSEMLSVSKHNCNTCDLEFYAFVQALKHWSSYLAYNEFVLYFDYEALKHLNIQDEL
jgi:hypothetical protein